MNDSQSDESNPEIDQQHQSDFEGKILSGSMRIGSGYRPFIGPWLWIPIILLSLAAAFAVMCFGLSFIWTMK